MTLERLLNKLGYFKDIRTPVEETQLHSDEGRYDMAVKLLLYEGDMLWKIVSTFLVVHVLLVGFITQP